MIASTPAAPPAPTLPAYSMSPDAMLERFRALEQRFPDLVEIRDIGDSAAKVNGKGGHDLWSVVLTDERTKGPKTILGQLGAVHGSELVAPTLLTEFAEQLVGGYGRDAQSTGMLRSREVHMIPMVNPDGVVAMRQMLSGDPAGRYGRPNANDVNINRNFPFGWGGNGADIQPKGGNYRGPAPASEPETRAVIDYFSANRPSVFVDWHNYGRLNLYSWGETEQSGPTTEGQHAVAERISDSNGHEAKKSAALYPVSGGSTDWAHGSLGATALTIETGGEDFLTDAAYDEIRRENMPALFDLVQLAAEDPVATARGPIAVGPWSWKTDAGRIVEAWATDTSTGAQAIKGAELVYRPGQKPGTGIPLKAADGSFDSPEEALQLPASGRRGPRDGIAYVRARDADGNWGALSAGWFRNPQPPAPAQEPGATPPS